MRSRSPLVEARGARCEAAAVEVAIGAIELGDVRAQSLVAKEVRQQLVEQAARTPVLNDAPQPGEKRLAPLLALGRLPNLVAVAERRVLEQCFDQGVHEARFAAEVVVYEGSVHSRLFLDRLHRETGVALLDEDAPGSLEDALGRGRQLVPRRSTPVSSSHCRFALHTVPFSSRAPRLPGVHRADAAGTCCVMQWIPPPP